MLSAKRTVLLFASPIVMATTAMAQKSVKKASIGQKTVPVKLISSLGNYSDSTLVPVDEAIQLINLPISITDDKKAVYTIASYQFLYKRKGLIEDEETGNVTPTSTIVSNLFKTTPISELWRNILTEQLQPGEELFLFDIVVKDAQGRLMFAPNIKIKTN